MASSFFTLTGSIKKAINLINDVDDAKFPRLLSRITQKLHLTEEHSFTADEEEKLQAALGLDSSQLLLILETCAFILEQAAYHNAKPVVLQQQLESLELGESKVSTFVQAWVATGKSVIEKLRQRTLAPAQLEEVNWRLNLEMCRHWQAKAKSPSAVLELGVSQADPAHPGKDKVRAEFTHHQLYQFYDQLEAIQSQLDSIS